MVTGHARKLSNESFGSDVSSLRGSEMSNSGIPNSSGDGSLDLPGGAEGSRLTEILGNTDFQFSGDAQVVLPSDQRHKLNRVLFTMQRRLVTAKTDMEDLIARLNQEIAVKDYLATKVCSIMLSRCKLFGLTSLIVHSSTVLIKDKSSYIFTFKFPSL
jgi:hypothetical protein